MEPWTSPTDRWPHNYAHEPPTQDTQTAPGLISWLEKREGCVLHKKPHRNTDNNPYPQQNGARPLHTNARPECGKQDSARPPPPGPGRGRRHKHFPPEDSGSAARTPLATPPACTGPQDTSAPSPGPSPHVPPHGSLARSREFHRSADFCQRPRGTWTLRPRGRARAGNRGARCSARVPCGHEAAALLRQPPRTVLPFPRGRLFRLSRLCLPRAQRRLSPPAVPQPLHDPRSTVSVFPQHTLWGTGYLLRGSRACLCALPSQLPGGRSRRSPHVAPSPPALPPSRRPTDAAGTELRLCRSLRGQAPPSKDSTLQFTPVDPADTPPHPDLRGHTYTGRPGHRGGP